MLSTYLSLKEKKKIPLFLIIILITILMIVFYLLFSIIPLSQSIKKIRQKIHQVTGEMRLIEKIIPAYAKARRFDDIEFQHKFPLVNSEILDRDNLPDLLNKFESMATEHNLILLHNKLDIRFMDTQSKFVMGQIELRGQLQEFRDFLISLISQPFFKTIEKINIITDKSNVKRYVVNIKINVEDRHE